MLIKNLNKAEDKWTMSNLMYQIFDSLLKRSKIEAFNSELLRAKNNNLSCSIKGHVRSFALSRKIGQNYYHTDVCLKLI